MNLQFCLLFFMWVSLHGSTEGITTTIKDTGKGHSNINTQDFFEKFFEHRHYGGSPRPPRLDLVFILDSSSSLGRSQFKSLKTLIQTLVSPFSVSPSTTRTAFILCSENPSLEFSINNFVNKECAVKSTKKARFVGGHQCILDRSLQMAHRILFQARRSTSLRYRPKPMVFILSASPLASNYRTLLAFKKLNDFRTEIFFVSLGKPFPKSDIFKLIFTNWVHYLAVDSLSELEDHLFELIKSKGMNPQSCHTKGIVYDECRRRCRCSNGQMIDCYRVRKEFTSMSLEERRLYIRVLKTVSTLHPYKRVYDTMMDSDFPDNKFDPKVEVAQAVYYCHDDEDDENNENYDD